MIKPLTNPELDSKLYELPNEIFKEANILVDLRYAYEKTKAEYENALDKAYLMAKTGSVKATIAELEARARDDNFSINLEVIQAEAIFRKQENKVNQLKDKFDACRSSIKLRCAEIGAGG